MSSLPLWGYGVVLVGSLVLSLVLVPVALAVAVRFGALDHPGPAKGHTKAVPYLGGAAIVVAFAAVVLVGNALDPPPSGLPQLAGFLGLGVLLALVGLVDDLRGGLSPLLRLVLEAGAAVAVWAMGSDAHLAGVPSAVDALVSVVWIVGVTNAFNLLDLRPGRALKVFVLLGAGLTAGTAELRPLLSLGLFAGPALVAGGHDLREHGMLGDTGANLIGALAGLWLVLSLGSTGQIAALAVLLAINVYGELRSISALVQGSPLLRRLDSWGRPS